MKMLIRKVVSVIEKPSYESKVNDFQLIMDFMIMMERVFFIYHIEHELDHTHSQYRTRIRSYTESFHF